ncbi:MAG: hypothetical protein ACKVII_00845 [Planctomycetales bacterium]|jgi:hypothetical protein
MNCQEVREQLDAALDDQRVVSGQTKVARDADVVAHAESCPDCRVLYEEHLLIESALAVWTPRRPAVDLTDRVIEAARQEGLISSNGSAVAADVGSADLRVGQLGSDDCPYLFTAALPRTRMFDAPSRLQILAAATTAVLILLAAFIVFREGQNQIAKDERPAQQLSPDRQTQQLVEPHDQVADIGHLVADAQSAWRGITSRVSHQASGFSVFVPDLKNELGISDVMESPERTPGSVNPDNDDESQKSTRPSAVEKAFEFLFDDAESGNTRTI